MNGRKESGVDIEKHIDKNEIEPLSDSHSYDTYVPTTNELDDDDPPSEDSGSSDSGP